MFIYSEYAALYWLFLYYYYYYLNAGLPMSVYIKLYTSIKYTMHGPCEIKCQVKYTFAQPLCDHGIIISF